MYHQYEKYNNNPSICTLPVTIWTPKGDVYLETQPSYTIGHVKAMIQEKKGIAADGAKLVFGSRYLEDGHTLSGCSIQDGATLNLGRMEVHVYLYHTSFNPSKYQSHVLLHVVSIMLLKSGSHIKMITHAS